MRINFRQGVVSYQAGGFLRLTSGSVDIAALNRPVTVSVAHKQTDYIHSEDNDVTAAWAGPFAASTNYWLYWDFNKLTFQRTFGYTTLEPVAQSVPPGYGNSEIVDVVTGTGGIGQFIVDGEYILLPGKTFAVINSTNNDGSYSVISSNYDGITGRTSIAVAEDVVGPADGEATLDIDSSGNPLQTVGRMWYDTGAQIQYEWIGTDWVEVIRVFAAQLINANTFLSMSINANTGNFAGTQIGDTSSVLAGRVLILESSTPIQRDNGTFFTTEDQFFTSQSRVDALRLESNVARAQSSSASVDQYQPVSWTSDGRVQSSVYDDIGETVIGILTEPLLYSEVGAIIVQGTVTNAAWNWTDQVPVGSELWIDNGDLVAYDPHVVDANTYPTGRVPVARVLSTDTIIFEQGLGGKGDRGPAGTVTDLPPATTTDLGAVTLSTPSSNPLFAYVVSDTDPRLTDSRVPLPHVHAGINITIIPTGDVSANNVQGAISELANEKLAIAGGTMLGPLTLFGNPISPLHATTKQYVDNLVSGLVWLNPISLLNLISDNVTIPPVAPQFSDAYIVPPGASGDWSSVTTGNVVIWDTTQWLDRGPISGFSTQRVGVAFDTITPPSGSFAGQKNNIAQFDAFGVLQGFQIPVTNNAVYISGDSSLHAFDQYAFNGSDWVLFGGAQAIVPDGVTFDVVNGIAFVIAAADGGQVDARWLEGYDIAALDFRWSPIGHNHDLLYSALGHTHTDNEVLTAGYVGATDWGTPADPASLVLSAGNVENNLEELMEKKASKTPSYADASDFPVAANVEGMTVYAEDTQEVFFSDGVAWTKYSIDGHSHTLNLPYDLSFFLAGNLLINSIVGSFIATRNIHIEAGAAGSLAYANTAIPVSQASVALSVTHNGLQIGTITFTALATAGIISIPLDVDLVAGDRLQIVTPNPINNTLKDIVVTIVGCATATPCSL